MGPVLQECVDTILQQVDANGIPLKDPVTGYTRSFHYDRRGLIPPLYPTVPNSLTPDTPSARTIAWKEI